MAAGAKTVFCIRHQRELPGLARAPFPGAEGEEIGRQVSQQAWSEWLAEQTKLINEYQLSPLDPATRVYLKQQRSNFLHNRPIQPFASGEQ